MPVTGRKDSAIEIQQCFEDLAGLKRPQVRESKCSSDVLSDKHVNPRHSTGSGRVGGISFPNFIRLPAQSKRDTYRLAESAVLTVNYAAWATLDHLWAT